MTRNKWLPGVRPFVYIASAFGLARAASETAQEATAPKEPVDPETYHSHDDVDANLIWKIGIGLILTLWAIVVLIYPLFQFFKYDRTGGKDPSKVLAYVPRQPPRPRNEDQPILVIQQFRKREDGQLNNYFWVSRSKGIVSIPIARAMQLVAQRGVPPSKPPANANEYWPPASASMMTGFERKVEPEPR